MSNTVLDDDTKDYIYCSFCCIILLVFFFIIVPILSYFFLRISD